MSRALVVSIVGLLLAFLAGCAAHRSKTRALGYDVEVIVSRHESQGCSHTCTASSDRGR